MPPGGYKTLTVRDEVLEIAERLGKVLRQTQPEVVLRALQEIEEMWQTPPAQRTVPKMVQVLDVEASKQSTPLPPAPVVYSPVPPRGAVLNESRTEMRRVPGRPGLVQDPTPGPEERKKYISKAKGQT